MIRTTVKISGMMCGMCEAHINDAVRSAFSVRKVSSSRTREETVILSEEPLDPEKLRRTIEATGYSMLSVSQEITEKKPLLAGILKRNRQTAED